MPVAKVAKQAVVLNLSAVLQKSPVMDRKILAPVLWVVALLCLGYAVYRSTAVRIEVMQNNQPTVYGEPQHGLLLGLCIVAAVCIACAVWLSERPREVVRREERQDFSRRTLA